MLNWKPYDAYKWKEVQQPRMTPKQKDVVERLALEILKLKPTDRAVCWGTAHPPGRHTQTVIHIDRGRRHRYSQHGLDLGLKIFKIFNPNNDCPAMAGDMVKFHRDQRHLLPGLPHSRVQNVHAAGVLRASGNECCFLIQEWIDGEVLEDKIKSGFAVDEFFQMADGLFLEIIIPLWSQGTAWWDVRDSNYVFTPARHLVMIDSDTLGQDVDEITAEPPVYTARNRHRITAMIRYRSTIGRMVGACFLPNRVAKKGHTVAAAKALVATHLSPVFCEPYPLAIDWENRAASAYQHFRKKMESLFKGSRPSGSAANETVPASLLPDRFLAKRTAPVEFKQA